MNLWSRANPQNTNTDDLDRRMKQNYGEEAIHYDRHRFSFKRGKLYHLLELETTIGLLAPLNGKLILDVATGTGRIALGLGQAGAMVVGLDLTFPMLQVAEQKARETLPMDSNHPSWLNANGRLLPFADRSFDTVTCFRFLHLLHPSLWLPFLQEIHRVLRPGGVLLLELFNPFYGGFLSLARQLWHRKLGIPGEQYIWPWRITQVLDGFAVKSIAPFWLPGMGLLGHEKSTVFRKVGQLCAYVPLKWFAGPFLVVAKR